MMVNKVYKLFFFTILFLVVVILTGGFIYKKYSEEGHVLGFKIEKVSKLSPVPSPPPSTSVPSLLPATPTIPEIKISPSNVPVSTDTSVPKYEINLINYSDKIKLNDNSTFTWSISGPETTVSFTAIVGTKQSNPGNLNEITTLEMTQYRILTNEFTNGTFKIPLTYIGNAVIPEYGTWYLRALAKLNGKNLWSDEFSLVVY